jgi:hypothetical protein
MGGFDAEDIHKEMFPVYSGKCLSHKAFHNWVEKRGKCFADDEEVKMDIRRGQYKSFDALAKRWDKCINVGVGYVEK